MAVSLRVALHMESAVISDNHVYAHGMRNGVAFYPQGPRARANVWFMMPYGCFSCRAVAFMMRTAGTHCRTLAEMNRSQREQWLQEMTNDATAREWIRHYIPDATVARSALHLLGTSNCVRRVCRRVRRRRWAIRVIRGSLVFHVWWNHVLFRCGGKRYEGLRDDWNRRALRLGPRTSE